MCGAGCAKKLFILCNIIVWVSGAALLGFGLWMKLDPTISHYLNMVDIHQSSPLLEHAATVFAVVGACAFVAGLVGFCAISKASQGLLFLYAILLLLVIAAEIAGGVMALMYRTQVEGELESSMMVQVKVHYHPSEPDMVEAWDYLQQTHMCCGAISYTDWRGSRWWNETKNATDRVPDSCCIGKDTPTCQQEADHMHHENSTMELAVIGCFTKMETWFDQHSLIMMILGFAIGACQILALVTACCLRSALKKQQYSKTQYKA